MRARSTMAALLAAILAGGVTYFVMEGRLHERDRLLAALGSENQVLKNRESRLKARVHPGSEAPANTAEGTSEGKKGTSGSAGTMHFQNDGPIERVVRLWLYLDDHPELSIPDLRLLSDDEWLRVANDFPLDSDESERRALSRLRSNATQHSGPIVIAALNKYMAANQGQAPEYVSQLSTYLSNPQDADFLGSFVRYVGEGPQTIIIEGPVLQVRRVDAQLDQWIVYARNGAFEVHSPQVSSP